MFKLPYNIVAVDIETTDADSDKGSVIQIAAIRASMEFKILGKFNEYVIPLDSYRNPEAMKVNGISEEFIQTNGKPLEDVLKRFEKFCEGDKELAAWGNYFDIPFLWHQYVKIGRPFTFSNKSMDLKSIAIWEMAKRGIPMYYGVKNFTDKLGIGFKGNDHDAAADILNSLRILNTFIEK